MSSFRRLAKDHTALRASLPPNYLFALDGDTDSLPDDLTQLSIHLTGSEGTPYSLGLWLLHLRIPQDYPKSPPKATFKTRIFHPNVEEATGAVCLETLKRDWDPKLTLKDILITISCLLIQPNPDSALNEKAGVLVREDYEGFVRQARLMTKIHAPIPASLKNVVDAARRRGEDDMDGRPEKAAPREVAEKIVVSKTAFIEVSSSDESADSAKENTPSQRVVMPHKDAVDLKKHVLGKRPLTELSYVTDQEELGTPIMNQPLYEPSDSMRPRKSPKHTHQSQASAPQPASGSSDGRIADFTVAAPQVEMVLMTTNLPIGSSNAPLLSTKPKYRTYARVGIKRL